MERDINKNITLMLLSISFLYVLGNLPYAIYFVSTRIFKIKPDLIQGLFVISQCSLYFLIIFKVFIYYFFNKMFRKEFDNIFHSLFKINNN
jgi:hypothetical protein